MKSLVWFRFTRFNNTFYLLTALLGLINFRCHLVGYFSAATFNNRSVVNAVREDQLPKMYIGVTKKPSGKQKQEKIQLLNPQRLNVIDARLKNPVGRHTLAVCLQPIFFFADWTLLIQFFETWITQGATKFYIYVQSMAPEVEELLQAYEADPDIDIERVHWAPLPNENSSSEPNNYVYRGEVVASVNDCILRARGKAKLVVSSDLDEIVYAHGQPLLTLLETLIVKYPKAAAFLFRTRMAAFQVN
uniref:Glycosyltransferase family 92 protein n=1 Tax=Syphacia muris TaxID=451379 RepID=A0A0N5ATA2_9BILA